MKKHDKNPADYRPDITHQCLLMLMDSPLNRAGLLQVYIHTERNVLIEINPQTRIPRTFNRFCGLMGRSLFVLCLFCNFDLSSNAYYCVALIFFAMLYKPGCELVKVHFHFRFIKCYVVTLLRLILVIFFIIWFFCSTIYRLTI